MSKRKRIKYDTLHSKPPLQASFYRSKSGRELVREWLDKLSNQDKKRVGRDLRRLQMQWPIGMPLVRKIEKDLWEIRTHLATGLARTLFTISQNRVILLHGFIKKTAKLPLVELDTARRRHAAFRSEGLNE